MKNKCFATLAIIKNNCMDAGHIQHTHTHKVTCDVII